MIMYWYLKVLKQYADFSGRARRKEYWMFELFNFLIYLLILALAGIFYAVDAPRLGMFIIFIVYLYALGILIPNLAVAVRRLHDVGKSGWMLFIYFVPLIGVFWLLILLLSDSEPGDNEWGSNPKEVKADASTHWEKTIKIEKVEDTETTMEEGDRTPKTDKEDFRRFMPPSEREGDLG
jgi:uncharacterized membrane protein YhaH (DUF805 family)